MIYRLQRRTLICTQRMYNHRLRGLFKPRHGKQYLIQVFRPCAIQYWHMRAYYLPADVIQPAIRSYHWLYAIVTPCKSGYSLNTLVLLLCHAQIYSIQASFARLLSLQCAEL